MYSIQALNSTKTAYSHALNELLADRATREPIEANNTQTVVKVSLNFLQI